MPHTDDDGDATKSGNGQRFYFGDRNADTTAHVRAASPNRQKRSNLEMLRSLGVP